MVTAETKTVFGLGVGDQFTSDPQPFTEVNRYYLLRALGVNPFVPDEQTLKPETLSQIIALGRISAEMAALGKRPQVREFLEGREAVAVYLGQSAEFKLGRNVQVGDKLLVTSYLQGVREEKNHLFVGTRCCFEDKTEIVEGVGVVLLRKMQNVPGEVNVQPQDPDGNGYGQDTITYQKIVSYALGVGDWNIVHLDTLGAQMAGFPDRIAHGMLSMAYSLMRLPRVSGCNLPVSGFNNRFVAPVCLNDRIETAPQPLTQDKTSGRWTIPFAINRQGNIPVVTGNYFVSAA